MDDISLSNRTGIVSDLTMQQPLIVVLGARGVHHLIGDPLEHGTQTEQPLHQRPDRVDLHPSTCLKSRIADHAGLLLSDSCSAGAEPVLHVMSSDSLELNDTSVREMVVESLELRARVNKSLIALHCFLELGRIYCRGVHLRQSKHNKSLHELFESLTSVTCMSQPGILLLLCHREEAVAFSTS